MPTIKDYYKPLKDHLSYVNLRESLYVIRYYIQHLQFNRPFPEDIEVLLSFLNAPDWISKDIFPWELETLTSELIVNSMDSNTILAPNTLKKWTYFKKSIEILRTFENNMAKFLPEENIDLVMIREIHRQIPWQTIPNSISLARYFKIFSNKDLNNIIYRKIGLNINELYKIGLALTGVFKDNYELTLPPQLEKINVSEDMFVIFLNHFSCPLSTLKEEIIKKQGEDKDIYSFNPLRTYPLITVHFSKNESMIAPIPTLLIRRFTDGIYYEINKEVDFSNPFGESFQQYIGDVLEKASTADNFTIYPEQEYYVGKKERKDPVDWILDDQEAALFIEAKTKRLPLCAQIEISSKKELMKELDKMVSFIVQTYNTINDYVNGNYTHYKYIQSKKIFPIILTLENWYIWGDNVNKLLNNKVIEEMSKTDINMNFLEEMPYTICCCEEFEKLIQIINSLGIKNVMDKKVFDIEKRGWPVKLFYQQIFPEELKTTINLFPDIYSEISPLFIET